MKYYLTFGQKYRNEKHPKATYAHPDGWVTIIAPSEEKAREIAFNIFGQYWSNLYPESKWDPTFFPKGELKIIKIV